jgi:hypothetical protein
MKKNELFEIFDRYDTYEFIKEGESIHGIKCNDLNGLADELVKLFNVSNRRELLLDFAEYSENDKTSTVIDECVDNYLDSIK